MFPNSIRKVFERLQTNPVAIVRAPNLRNFQGVCNVAFEYLQQKSIFDAYFMPIKVQLYGIKVFGTVDSAVKSPDK
jgi:hypothetical protein